MEPDALSGPDQIVLHASTVALFGQACLIRGASGTGKSALALQLMAMGAVLVADDRTILRRAGDDVITSAPVAIRGLIEARFVGLLRADVATDVPLGMIVDLDVPEAERLPPLRTDTVLGRAYPVLRRSPDPAFPAAIRQYLAHGRHA